MKRLDGGRDIEIAMTLLIDTLACLKRADAPNVAEHVMEALRQIDRDFGLPTLQDDFEAAGGAHDSA